MSEVLRGTTGEFFRGILSENLREPRNSKTAVLTVGGLSGSGVTSTCLELAHIFRSEYGIPVIRYSSSEEAYRLTREKTGNKFREPLRDPDSIREVDRRFAEKILSPDSANTLILADGRFTAFVTKGLEHAGRNYPIKLPFNALGVFLSADDDTRVARKFIDGLQKGSTADLDGWREELETQMSEEESAFLNAYIDVQPLVAPTDIAFKLSGEDVYSLRYSTDALKPASVAQKIAQDEHVQELLQTIRTR